MNLLEGEKVLGTYFPSMPRTNPVGFVILLLFCFLIIGIPFMIAWYFDNRSTNIRVTNLRVIFTKGMFSKQQSEVFIQDIRNVHFKQSAIQRLFQTGTLSVSSAAQSDVEIQVSGLTQPEKIRDQIQSVRHQQISGASKPQPKSDLPLPAPAATGPGKYKVIGVDKDSRMDVTSYVNADSPDAAKIKAELEGIVVTAVSKA